MGPNCCAPDRSANFVAIDGQGMVLSCRGSYAAEIIQLNPYNARWLMDRIDYGILTDASEYTFYPDPEYEKERALLLLRCGYLRDTYGDSTGLNGVCPAALNITPKGATALAACKGLSAPLDRG